MLVASCQLSNSRAHREFLHVRNPRFDIAVHLLDASHLPKKLHIALYDSKDWLQTSVGIWTTLSGRLNLQNVYIYIYTHTHQYFRYDTQGNTRGAFACHPELENRERNTTI